MTVPLGEDASVKYWREHIIENTELLAYIGINAFPNIDSSALNGESQLTCNYTVDT